jgi:hypothetical protein
MEDHPGHGFARRDHVLCIWHETGIAHVHQPSGVDHRNDHAQVIETLDANLFHWSTPPLKLIEAATPSAEDQRVFRSEHLLNVG